MVVIDNRTGGVVAWLGGGEFLRPRRPGRPGARASLAWLGAEAPDLRHGVRRSHPASGVAGRGRAGALQGLAAAQLRARSSGCRHRAPRPATVAERARRAGAGASRAGSASCRPCAPRRDPTLPPGDPGTSLGMALGSATISPLEMAGLYRGSPMAGFAPPQGAATGRPEPLRLIGAPPPGTSPTCSPTRRCPTASPRCRSRCASGGLPTRPAPPPASATPGPRATAPTGPWSSGSAMPTARRGRASSAASPRCRSCSRRSAACPARTIARRGRRPT